MNVLPPAWVIGAVRSGAGKTTFTMALLRALRRQGVRVSVAKCGPDFIDPGMHSRAAGRVCLNLDRWAMRPTLLQRVADHLQADAELLIVEGVMGLFDGARTPGACGDGSTADLAAALDWPVVLVLDVSRQLQSAAAVALGARLFRDDLRVEGVVLNRVGSEHHAAGCRRAVESVGLRVLGCVPRDGRMQLPERHLGLVQAQELPALDARLDQMADVICAHVDLQALRRGAPRPPRPGAREPALRPPAQRVAVAQDAAFSFMYPHVLLEWRAAGVEVLPFSPLADQAPDPRAEVCWLPGGYPELYAGPLSARRGFMEGLRAFAKRGRVHGECGGYMVLGASLTDAQGETHGMAGLLGHRSSVTTPRLHLGYRRVTLAADSVLGRAGEAVRGHEFHYASARPSADDAPLFSHVDGTGVPCIGSARGRVTGSFLHFIDAA